MEHGALLGSTGDGAGNAGGEALLLTEVPAILIWLAGQSPRSDAGRSCA